MTYRSRYSLTGICSKVSSVERNLQNALLLASRELAREIDFEFIDQFRNTILTAASMTNGVLHHHFFKSCAVGELKGNGIGDGAFFRVVVVSGKCRIFKAIDLLAQGVNAFILRNVVLVICRR